MIVSPPLSLGTAGIAVALPTGAGVAEEDAELELVEIWNDAVLGGEKPDLISYQNFVEWLSGVLCDCRWK